MPVYNEMRQRARQMEAEGATYSNNRKYAELKEAIDAHPMDAIVEKIKSQIIDLDRQLGQLSSIGLTDEEKNNFLQKAIEQVNPYYERKYQEVEQRLEEGQVQTAEDILLELREVEQDIGNQLAEFDLSTAQTEEEFVDRISALTAQTEDKVENKRQEWKTRIEGLKMNQIQKGIFSSGIGEKKREREKMLKDMDIGQTQERAQEQRTALERNKKFNLEQVQLAREAAQQRRNRLIGTPDETAATRQQARGTLGLGQGEQLPSEAQVLQQRDARQISPLYDRSKLTDLESERLRAIEDTKLELQEGELSLREQRQKRQREKILADMSEKEKKLRSYGVNY